MQGVFTGFATIGVVIAVGALLAHLRIVDLTAQRVLSQVAFFVGSPALMVMTLSRADVQDVLSENLVATSAGVLVPVVVYAACARFVWRRRLGDATIGALSVGIRQRGQPRHPGRELRARRRGPRRPHPAAPAPRAPADRSGAARHRRPRTGPVAAPARSRRPFTNPLTLGSLAGVLLSVTGWTLPDVVGNPLELLGNLAVPSMLIAYGIALRLGPGLGAAGSVGELATTSALKLVVQPLVAYAVAHLALGVDGPALLAVVVTSALPTAQNIFVHATRYDRGTVLARDTILITTVGAVPVILLIAALLG